MRVYMTYAGQTVEVFAYTPLGQEIPCLASGVAGEAVRDYAYIDDKAMQWNGLAWIPSLWKDFAVWTRVDA